jgi:hypothetical protein
MVKRVLAPLLALLSGALVTSACGVKDLDFTFSNSGAGGQGGKTSGNAGNQSGGGGDSGGGDGGGGDGGGDTSVPFTCHAGERRCTGNTPEECSEEGAWVAEKPCSGTDKVCSGAGTCASYLLVNAGIEALGLRPKESSLVLKRQTLAATRRSCSASGLCVTGAIR